MAKRIEIDGKYYRIRRGALVQIPDEWVGQVPNPQTIRKRKSKQHGHRKRRKPGFFTGGYQNNHTAVARRQED